MARRPRVFAPGLLYHVIVRGNQRRKTFRSDDDYKAYFDRLEKYRAQCHVRIYAYCLMPNHVHLLVETGSTPLAKFMQGLQQSYTQHFNRRYRKVGHLFQGRYQAIICDRDKYLLALVRYIHLNAVRAKLATRPERYRYSGHNSYLTNDTPKIVDVRPILKLMGGKKAYERFVLEGIGETTTRPTTPSRISAFWGRKGLARKSAGMPMRRMSARQRNRSRQRSRRSLGECKRRRSYFEIMTGAGIYRTNEPRPWHYWCGSMATG